MSDRVVIVGAGLIGLTCAVRLAEAGYDTQIFARDLPLETSSAADAGLWLPQQLEPADDVLRWAGSTFDELTRLASDPDSGVRLTSGQLLYRPSAALRPWWAAAMANRVRLEEISRPRAGYDSGWVVRLPVVDQSLYLRHLLQRIRDAGGSLTRMAVSTLPQRGVVVNATGASARWLADDPEVVPVRGQVVVLSNPGLSGWWSVQDRETPPLFLVPHGDRVLVGSTADPQEWDATSTQEATENILGRALQVEPRLEDATVVGQRVGLRPSRGRIRLEKTSGGRGTAHRTLVHCYGHDDNGLTLSWGCADDVLRLVQGLQPSLF